MSPHLAGWGTNALLMQGAIMRMLTRTHLEKEFQLGKHYRPVALQGTSIWGSGPPLTPRISDRAIAT